MNNLFEKLTNGTINVAYTHGGVFHADDVFSAALLRYLNPEITFNRVFKVDQLSKEDLIFDIGWGEYDHHQPNAALRDPEDLESKYAAFGLLWRDLGPYIVNEEEAKKFDDSFIRVLDHSDNFGDPNTLSTMIGAMNPNWDSEEDKDDAFNKAVEVATILLSNKLDSIKSKLRARKIVENNYNASPNKEIIFLHKFVPWHDVLVPSEAKFVIYPSQRGGYNLQVVPVALDTNEAKIDLPESWLDKECSPKGMSFCHSARFLAAFDTLDNTFDAALSILE